MSTRSRFRSTAFDLISSDSPLISRASGVRTTPSTRRERILRRRTIAAPALALVFAGAAVPAIAQNDSGPQQGPPASGPAVPPPDERIVPAAERPAPPTYAPGAGKVVPANSPVNEKYNPHGSPNIRVCEMSDGTYIVMHTFPKPGKDPYPNDPEDLRYRPC